MPTQVGIMIRQTWALIHRVQWFLINIISGVHCHFKIDIRVCRSIRHKFLFFYFHKITNLEGIYEAFLKRIPVSCSQTGERKFFPSCEIENWYLRIFRKSHYMKLSRDKMVFLQSSQIYCLRKYRFWKLLSGNDFIILIVASTAQNTLNQYIFLDTVAFAIWLTAIDSCILKKVFSLQT